MKLMITGGHLTPALAFIDHIKADKTKEHVQIIFVGRRWAIHKDKSPSLEFQEISARKIKFINLTAGRFTRVLNIRSLYNLAKIPVGFLRAWKILRKEKPNVILSFGGYLAVPIAIVGALLRIPIYTHEQTIKPGLANIIIGKFAKRIFISFPETKKYFNLKKVIITGNPVREQVFKVETVPFLFNKDKPVIYITGGSLGSHSINAHIEKILPQLLEQYFVIHQSGNVKEYHDYQHLEELKKSLPKHLQKHYFLQTHFMSNEIGAVFSLADMVISRSGANTFFELLFLKKPAVLIPLPWSGNKEQQLQAQSFQKMGLGEVFDQSHASEELAELITKVMVNLDEYKTNFNKLKTIFPEDAVKTIVQTIF